MSRIDVSAIQPTSIVFTTDPEEEHLTKHSSLDHPPSHPSHQSRKHAIFKQFEGALGGNSQDQMSSNKPRTQFKIPSNDDYYIRQSRENINPNKAHRMDSMIGNPSQEKSSQPQGPSSPTPSPPERKSYLREISIGLIIIILIFTLVEKGSETISSLK